MALVTAGSFRAVHETTESLTRRAILFSYLIVLNSDMVQKHMYLVYSTLTMFYFFPFGTCVTFYNTYRLLTSLSYIVNSPTLVIL